MAAVVSVDGEEVVLQIKVKLRGSMLDMEEGIQAAVNEAGNLATKEALKRFDTTGAPIQIGSARMTSRGLVLKRYETPYGLIDVERHLYQTSAGGKTYCPLDDRARIVTSSTPHFACQISSKYARLTSQEVMDDLAMNHGCMVVRASVQNIADTVGSIAAATEEAWMYETPKQDRSVTTVSISLDGTCIYLCQDGWREAMSGTIALYDRAGERLHTIYLGAAPEYGKAKFLERLEREVYAIKLQYPDATYVGIADGAKSNWEFLEKHTRHQILDFYHASEYLTDASYGMYPMQERERTDWLDIACHRLKHESNGASDLLNEMKAILPQRKKQELIDKIQKAITYFTNQGHRMHYEHYRAMNFPIGSGVTEAACKTLIKQRLCQSGMKWKDRGVAMVLRLRALVSTKGRWEQFWDRINQAGLMGLGNLA